MSTTGFEEFNVCDLVGNDIDGYWCEDWLQIYRVDGAQNNGEEPAWS